MRITTWNCRGAFWRKQARVARLRPDILVVPEAERLGADWPGQPSGGYRTVHWIGDNPRKGLGVVSYGAFSLAVHPQYEPRHRWILPLVVNGPTSCLLFAVWTVPHARNRSYAQAVLDALDSYADLLTEPNVVWAGDFNNNTSLDRAGRRPTFASCVARLADAGLHSVYHLSRGLAHGAERRQTFYLYHHAHRGFHIDFVYATPAMCTSKLTVTLGTHRVWSKLSDHMPLTCTFGRTDDAVESHDA